MLAQLVCAHLFGDFVLQNNWMQAKSRSSFVCTVHVFLYAVPFLFVLAQGRLPVWCLLAILIQHWFQDRFSLHLKWMNFHRQTSPDKWPTGPLCVDQAMHISFIWLVWLLKFGF